jgi:putative SOS response-associated peptidase YedK
MCGRATVVNPDGITEKVYGYTSKFTPGDWKPRYNLNPREQIPAVYFDPFLKQRVLRPMHWNFIPSKLANRERVKEFDSQYSAFNARIETVASAPTFQEAWRSQRCLVVIDGIIEWVGTRRNKIPHLLRHPGGAPFAMAGLWNRWHDRSTNEEVWSCTVIVKDPTTGTPGSTIGWRCCWTHLATTSGWIRRAITINSRCSVTLRTTRMEDSSTSQSPRWSTIPATTRRTACSL